jgi:hypothetical protein
MTDVRNIIPIEGRDLLDADNGRQGRQMCRKFGGEHSGEAGREFGVTLSEVMGTSKLVTLAVCSKTRHLTVTSPVYDIVIAGFEEAVVLDMESIRQCCAFLSCRRAWLHPFHSIKHDARRIRV